MSFERQELVIERGSMEKHYWRDLWRYRELFYILSWRDITIRYKQAALGVAWAIIRPLLTMIVFTIIFGKLSNLPSYGVPYPILVFSAMLPWQFFSNAFSGAADSLVGNSNLISKVYFPRLTIPFSAVMVSFIEFLISAVILAVLMLWYQFVPTWRIVVLPIFVIFVFFAAFGTGLWISVLNVKYRDFRFIVPFIVQFGLYISPVGFATEIVPEKWRLLYSLNPMVGVIDGFRWAILGQKSAVYLPGVLLSVIIVTVIMWTGVEYFRRAEKTFADNI